MMEKAELQIKPVTVSERAQGSPWLREAYDAFADIRRHLEQYSEEELNTAIDEAIAAVRARRALTGRRRRGR